MDTRDEKRNEMRARRSTLARAEREIAADVESSRRHWTEVRDAAAVRMNDATWSEKSRARNRAEHEVAILKLAALERGERVSLSLNMEPVR